MDFLKHTLVGLRSMLLLTVILGVFYPVLIWGIGRVIAPAHADGSLVAVDGRPVGSHLIAQKFPGEEWLWPRPSAADYDAMASSGSNLGPNDESLRQAIEERRAKIAKACGVAPDQVPADAVTASASGLDPDISPAYAEIQVHRIAQARHLSEDQVRMAIKQATHERPFGVLGQPSVNVLDVNVALSKLR